MVATAWKATSRSLSIVVSPIRGRLNTDSLEEAADRETRIECAGEKQVENYSYTSKDNWEYKNWRDMPRIERNHRNIGEIDMIETLQIEILILDEKISRLEEEKMVWQLETPIRSLHKKRKLEKKTKHKNV